MALTCFKNLISHGKKCWPFHIFLSDLKKLLKSWFPGDFPEKDAFSQVICKSKVVNHENKSKLRVKFLGDNYENFQKLQNEMMFDLLCLEIWV